MHATRYKECVLENYMIIDYSISTKAYVLKILDQLYHLIVEYM